MGLGALRPVPRGRFSGGVEHRQGVRRVVGHEPQQALELAPVVLGHRVEDPAGVLGEDPAQVLLKLAARVSQVDPGDPLVRRVLATDDRPAPLQSLEHGGHGRGRHVEDGGQLALAHAVVPCQDPEAERLARMGPLVGENPDHQLPMELKRPHVRPEDGRRERVHALDLEGRQSLGAGVRVVGGRVAADRVARGRQAVPGSRGECHGRDISRRMIRCQTV